MSDSILVASFNMSVADLNIEKWLVFAPPFDNFLQLNWGSQIIGHARLHHLNLQYKIS